MNISEFLAKKIPKGLHFPAPFFTIYTPAWLCCLVLLVGLDLTSKKVVTNMLNFNLNYLQLSQVPQVPQEELKSLAYASHADGVNIIPLLGQYGKYIKFQLVFNDRFVFGLGPAWPIMGFVLSLLATLFLLLYRWYNAPLGHPIAWLLIFSGALGNLIDKLFIKSLTTREWVFSLAPQKGYVSGVVDFIECIWFGWESLGDTFLLNFLAMRTWPTFNLADSFISVGIVILFFGILRSPPQEKK